MLKTDSVENLFQNKTVLPLPLRPAIQKQVLPHGSFNLQSFLQFAFTSGTCLHFMQALVFSKASCLHFPQDF